MLHTRTFANGVRAVADRVEGAGAVYVTASFGVGSGHESEAEGGVAHFLEHLMFKSDENVSLRFGDLGADANAGTSFDDTSYWVSAIPDNALNAIALLCTMLTGDHVSVGDVEREKAIVLREMDTHGGSSFDEGFVGAAFGDHAIARPTIGTEDSIEELDAYAVLDFRERFYRAPNLIVSVVGDVEPDAVFDTIERGSAALSNEPSPSLPTIAHVGGEYAEPCRCERGSVLYAVAAADVGADTEAADETMAFVLGGGPTSRLFQELRERRGLAYSASAGVWTYGPRQLLGIDVHGEAKRTRDLLAAAHGELVNLAKGVDEAEVARAALLQTAELSRDWDHLGRRTTELVETWRWRGKPRPLREAVEAIRSVNVDDVLASARRALAAPATLAAHGKHRTLAGLSDIPTADLPTGEALAA